MKLCFIWVKKYKGFRDLSLNLSDEFNFEYDINSNCLLKTKNDNFIPSLFEENISCVTAIVGKNGAGKSNCLELICTILQGSMYQFDTEFISVIEHESNFHISHTLTSKLTINFPHSIVQEKGKAKGFNTIFFSNVHDERYYEFSDDVVIATANNGYGYRNLFSSKWRRKPNLFSIQVDLITKHRRSLQDDIKISLPNYIMVEFAPIREKIRYDIKSEDFIRAFKKRLSDMVSNENKFSCMLKYSFLLQIYEVLFKTKRKYSLFNFEFMEKEPTDLFLNRAIKEILQEIKDLEFDPEQYPNFPIEIKEQIKDDFKTINSICDAVKNLSPLLISSKPGSFSTSFEIKFSPENHDTIKKLCYSLNSNRLIRMSWIGISSGAKAYLTLLAVLNDKLKGTRNDTLICIDEGDLYLHPEWQIDFLHNLNKMLPKFSNANLQLVLTSHSPFLLTDLPRDNVIIINDKCVVDKFNTPLRTFGSNLYDLYNNAFFLKGKRFGALAEAHIETITNKINNNDFVESERQSIEKFIEIIGDKLLRNVLKGLLKDD